MTGRGIRQFLRQNPTRADALLVVALTVVAVVTSMTLMPSLMAPWGEPPAMPVIVVWAVAYTLPLLWRRRFPCTVLMITALHFAFYMWVEAIASSLVLGAAVYSAAAYGRPRRAAWCFGLASAALIAWTVVHTLGWEGAPPEVVVVSALMSAAPYVLGWALGLRTRTMRTLREYRSVLEQRNAELTVEREANARRAVLEERVRIARELHDVVAHHVSLMGIQAGVAHRLFRSRPDDALEAVAAVQTGSQRAITELQQLLGVLRGAGDPADGTGHHARDDDIDCESRQPAPDLSQLPALLATVRHAGLPVDFAVHGHRTPLTPSLELSTYRIVQEALTNTLKHAGAARAGVTLRYHHDAGVEVEIVDDGRGPRPDTVPGGRGLVGMQERVNLHGGRLNVGPLQDGGYRVHAVLGLS